MSVCVNLVLIDVDESQKVVVLLGGKEDVEENKAIALE
jgi:hypothetical protein